MSAHFCRNLGGERAKLVGLVSQGFYPHPQPFSLRAKGVNTIWGTFRP